MVAMNRSAGVLLHPTCLPSPDGIGDLGPTAHAYVDWLAAAGVGWWQVLPLNPPGPGQSPYSATSTFAGNPMLISPAQLLDDGLLDDRDLADRPDLPEAWVDYAAVYEWKTRVLRRAHERFRSEPGPLGDELEAFHARHGFWLDDAALFAAVKADLGGAAWIEWPSALAHRDPETLAGWRDDHRIEVEHEIFAQFLFHRQWRRLKQHADTRGVRLFGDIPIFVAHDSAEVWSRRELFLLDDAGRSTVVAGVPPDYFSATGQLWGNPLYDWRRMADNRYRWWVARLRHTLGMVDLVRLDHFRGFASYWEVPGDAEVATNGRWVAGPGRAFFDLVADELGGLPFVAEDLGEITDDVVELRDELGLPGMAILHFGFSPEPRSSFIPYAHTRNLVVYTGTHDNNTTRGWFVDDANDAERELVLNYTGTDGREIHWDLIRLALSSVADLAIVPHQDLAGLGGDCRMNTPAVGDGNWTFRITPWMLADTIRDRFAEMIDTYGRATEKRR